MPTRWKTRKMINMQEPVMSDHKAGDHEVTGDAEEQMRRIMARHLCGWISGHGAPVNHFLIDADMIMEEAREHGIRYTISDAVSEWGDR